MDEGPFDVLYLSAERRSLLGARLERESAIALARHAADVRGVGRMFLPGSEHPHDVVVIRPSAAEQSRTGG
jgi:hypothetical protein